MLICVVVRFVVFAVFANYMCCDIVAWLLSLVCVLMRVVARRAVACCLVAIVFGFDVGVFRSVSCL